MKKLMIVVVICAGTVSFTANAVAQNDRAAHFSPAKDQEFRVTTCGAVERCKTVLGKRICWWETRCPSGAVRG